MQLDFLNDREADDNATMTKLLLIFRAIEWYKMHCGSPFFDDAARVRVEGDKLGGYHVTCPPLRKNLRLHYNSINVPNLPSPSHQGSLTRPLLI